MGCAVKIAAVIGKYIVAEEKHGSDRYSVYGPEHEGVRVRLARRPKLSDACMFATLESDFDNQEADALVRRRVA
jgi:hypothetical protein